MTWSVFPVSAGKTDLRLAWSATYLSREPDAKHTFVIDRSLDPRRLSSRIIIERR